MLNSLPWNKKENAQCTMYTSHFFYPHVNSSNYIGSIISVEKILRRTVSAKFQPILILPEKKKGDSKKDMKSRPSLEKDPTHAFYLITKVDE